MTIEWMILYLYLSGAGFTALCEIVITVSAIERDNRKPIEKLLGAVMITLVWPYSWYRIIKELNEKKA